MRSICFPFLNPFVQGVVMSMRTIITNYLISEGFSDVKSAERTLRKSTVLFVYTQ